MTPERWKRTEELYHAASARRPDDRAAFLAEACADDEALRREVESLLNEPSDERFLAGPALIAASEIASRQPKAMSGKVLGGYLLQSLLGAGGMGEVYRARDTRLGREVAIKILPAAFTSNEDRLARFEREARLLAALNHPNICTIYGVEEADGVRFLILELVEGASLAEMLAARSARQRSAGLALPLVLSLARQVTEALDAAHEKGIIHRDLKPANIKITSNDQVKVLDFGLAKSVGGESDASELTHAPALSADDQGEAALLGTTAYMSPEQARGQALDKRTDIWSFGCVFYEMLTGRPAFAGGTRSDTIARILEREPDWTALPHATPPAVRQVLARCLRKDHKQRLRDIGEVRLEIDALGDVPATSLDRAVPTRRLLQWVPVLLSFVFGALLVVIGPRANTAPTMSVAERVASAQFTRFTSWEGAEEGAAISPDGKFVAFLSDHAGEFDIWLSQVGTGRFANLTRDFPPLVATGSIVRKLGFSGDGADIWFNPADRKPLLLMPLTGGTPRAFLSGSTNTPAWSPDGTRFVYFGKPPDGADPMFLADRTGADAREVLAPQAGMHRNNPVWSLDGEWIYFVSGSEPQDELDMNIWRARVSGGSAEQLTRLHSAVNFLAPIDARTILYTARAEDGSGPWLWALDVAERMARRVPAGVDQFTSVASSRDGGRIVATVANPSSTLWQVPIVDEPVGEADAKPCALPVPSGRVRAQRFGGASMFYLSARGTSDGLWKVENGIASEVWRDVDGALFEPPVVSPDGRRVAVVIRRGGKRHLSIMSADGTNPRTLAASIEIEGAAGQGAASWSPDGKWIVAGGRDTRGPALFRIPVDGGEPERLLDGKWVNPVWSPDGNVIVYAGRSIIGQVRLLGLRLDGGSFNLPEMWIRPGGYRILPDGKGLVYLPGIHALDFWRLDFSTMRQRPLTRLGNRGAIRTFDITPDGKYIVFDRLRENSDIVLIDLATP